MREKLISVAVLFGSGYAVAFLAGWWFPWTSVVVGVLLLLYAIRILTDAKTRAALGFAGLVGFAMFGFLLFRSGRAELANNAAITAEVERIDRQIASVERMLAQGQFDDAIRLSVELESKATKAQATRLNQIKLSAENEAKLRPGRIKEANDRVSLLISAANKKVPNFNDVSEEAEQLLSEALSVPLATNLTGVRIFGDDLVRRRVAMAKVLLDEGRLDEAKAQVQAARAIKGATKFEDTKPLATAIANRIIARTATDVRKLIESEDFTTAEAKIRDVLNDPEATEREPALALLETVSKERAKVANTKLAGIVAEAQSELDAGRITEAEKLLNQANGLAHATERAEFDKLQGQVKAIVKDEQRKKDEMALLATKRRTDVQTQIPASGTRERFEYDLKKALGPSNRKVEKISKTEFTGRAITVGFTIDNNLTESFIKGSAQIDVCDILKAAKTAGLDYSEITVLGSFLLQDKFGNSRESKVVQATYKQATVNRINWEGFLTDNVYDIADEVWLHPTFR